jgi:hypothetical protein
MRRYIRQSICFNELNHPVSDTFSAVLLTNRRKIRQQEFDSEFVFVREGKDKDLLLKNAFYTICSTRRLIYLLE